MAGDAEFDTLCLGTVCDKLGSGATPRGGESVYLSEGIALIRSQNVHNNRFVPEGLAHIGPVHAAELDGVTVQAGDVLLNITGDSVARACQAVAGVLPARVNQHVAIIRPNPQRLDPTYLRYVLVSPAFQEFMLSIASSGGTRNALTKSMIEGFEVPDPGIGAQRAIARVLGTLDVKIELNRRMSATLEALARAVFRSWFVDFDPVVAKAAGRKPTGMTTATAALFPKSFDDSPLGPIPKGWQAARLDRLANLVSGGTPSKAKPEYWAGTIPWVSAKDMKQTLILDAEDHLTSEGRENGTRQVEAGCTLVLVRGMTLHNDVPICFTAREVAFNQDVKGIVPKDLFSRYFVFLSVREARDALLSSVDAASHGTGRINTETLRALPCVEAPEPVLREFSRSVEPVMERMIENERQSVTLGALRDALLPRLLSGELRLKEAERPAGAES